MPPALTSLRAKILAVVALLLAFIAVSGLLAVRALDDVGERGATMYADRVVPLDDVGQLRALLGDIDSMIQRAITDTDPANHAQYADQTQKDLEGVDALVAKYAATRLVPAETTGLATFRTAWAQYQQSFGRVLELTAARRPDAATRAYFASADSLYGESDAALAQLAEVNTEVAKGLSEDIHAQTAASKRTTVIVLLVALLSGTAVALFVVSRIVGGVGQVLRAADGIAAGDLAQDVDVRSRDEIGAMGAAFGRLLAYIQEMAESANRIATGDLTADVRARSERDTLGVALRDMQADLAGLVGSVQRNAGALAGSSQQMASTSEAAGRAVDEIAHAVSEVASGAERQVRSVEQAQSATAEVSAGTRTSAESARQTAQIAVQARQVAEDGSRAVADATEAMRQVRASSATVTGAMRGLSDKSERIGGIVETITAIAGQTNLLALNAAIEAARAGDQGRGFAVVADEVRKLAEESQDAAASIAALVAEIQAETAGAVVAVDESAERSEAGAVTVDRARTAFDDIRGSVTEMSGRVDDIAAAIEQIATSAERVQADMTEVAAVAEESSASSEQVSASTEETSASAQEIAASASQLATTATELEQLVSRFTVAPA